MNKPKFITTPTGPFLKYRLDILKECSPNIRDFIIIFTTKFSYSLYEEYHDFFDFVIMDDYREKNKFSMENEFFPEFKDEKEFLENINNFYNNETGVFYPWETHRFIFPYLIENNIKNFAIVDTDFLFNNNYDMLNDFFDTIPEGSLYMPFMGEESNKRENMWNSIQNHFPEIELKHDGDLICCDGYFRGFHFKNFDDMKLFYDIWNEMIKTPIKQKLFHPHKLYQTDWVVPGLMQIFETQRKYSFHNMWDFIYMKKYSSNVGRHYTRVEDTIYVGPRTGWDGYGFDYSDVTSISNFIKNNVEQLKQYYAGFDIKITNNHVYTSLKK